MTQKKSSDSSLGLDRPGCTLPTFLGGLVGFMIGGYLARKDYQTATEKAVHERGFADFPPFLVPVFAVIGALIGLFIAILLVIGWRMVSRFVRARTSNPMSE